MNNMDSHYKRADIDVLDFMEMTFKQDEFRGFLKGNALKYIDRCYYKGSTIQDLKKAIVYLERLIEFEKKIKE